MTQEFKEALLQYLIGKLPEETWLNEPQLQVQQEITNNFQQFVQENITEGTFSVNNYVQAGNSGKILLYGSVLVQGEGESFTYQGALVILDENLQPVQALTEFNTGTKFRDFVMLKIAEDNTIYGIDNDYSWDGNAGTNFYRFIMLNDVLSSNTATGNYQAILSKSYNFPTEYNKFYFGTSIDAQYRIWKKPNASSYLFIGRNDNKNFETGILQLTVNVGSENEWVYYNNSLNITTNTVCSYLQEWTDDNLILKIAGFYSQTSKYIELTLQGGQLSQTFVTDVSSPISSIAMINENTTYYSTENNNHDNNTVTLDIWKVDYGNNTTNSIYSRTDPYQYLGNTIYLNTVNNLVFVKIAIDKRIDNQIYDDVYLGMIFDDNLYFEYVGQTTFGSSISLYQFFVKNEFNLYTISVQGINVIQGIKINFNSLNYNGQSYLNTNALIPNSAELYSNNSLVFARNLYNKTTNDNITVSTIEVPFNYVNNIDITSKNLLSETNLLMVQDQNTIQKNIYESLLINFVNTFLVADKNNGNNVLNQPASNYINTSINDETAYTNAKFYDKIKVTYQDNSTKEVAFEYQNLNGSQVTIAFGLYVDKLMRSAEILSNDQTITYQTIDLMSLEQGKYYTIKQDLEVL